MNEGYATSRFTTPNTSPDRPRVPSSSPAVSTNPSPIRAPVFRSAADTLHDVYSTAAAFSSQSRPGVSPSRSTKRTKDDDEDEAGMNLPSSQDSVVADAHGRSARFDDWDPDDDDDMDEDTKMEFGDFPPIRLTPRTIAPLKRSSKNALH